MNRRYDARVVVVEFFGVARLRAGIEQAHVYAHSIGEALAEVAKQCPALNGTVVDNGRLAPGFVIAVNGLQITADPLTALRPGDALVVLSADAGG